MSSHEYVDATEIHSKFRPCMTLSLVDHFAASEWCIQGSNPDLILRVRVRALGGSVCARARV